MYYEAMNQGRQAYFESERWGRKGVAISAR